MRTPLPTLRLKLQAMLLLLRAMPRLPLAMPLLLRAMLLRLPKVPLLLKALLLRRRLLLSNL